MTDKPLSRQARLRSLIGVIAAMAVVNLVYGITFPLLALVLDNQGVSKTLIGLSTMAQALAVVVLAPWAPGLMKKIPPSRLMQVVTVLLAVLFIVAGLFPNVWFWFPLRFVIGALTALLWISSEALINDLARERWRGRVIGIYASVGAAGFAMGPLLLILTGSSGMLPFISTSVLVLAAGIPLFVVAHRTLQQLDDHAQGMWKLFLLAPAVMLANAVYAATAESQLTFFPIFAMGLGVAEEFSLGLMSIMGFGAMVLVMPLSWIADHVDRMGFLAVAVLLSMVGLLLMPHMIQYPVAGSIFMFVFGGVEGMIYALGVMLVGERFKGAMLAAATTLFTAFWGAGTVVGPLLTGIGMDRLGSDQMALILFWMFAVFLPLPVVSWWRRRGATVNESD